MIDLYLYFMSFYVFILMLGAFQGIILGGLLAIDGKRSNRILAIILFFFTYRLLVQSAFIQLGWNSVDHWTYQVFFDYNWVYGSLIYFYVASYLNPDFTWKRQDLWHFIPLIIEFTFSNWVKYQNYYWNGSTSSLPFLGAESYVLWVQTPFKFVVASVLILFYISKSKQLLRQLSNNKDLSLQASGLQWIRQILAAYQAFSILILITVLVDYSFFDYAFRPFYIIPIYAVMAIITYWLGLQGFIHKKDIPLKKLNRNNESLLQPIAVRLNKLMEEQQPYLDPDLNLNQLAELLEVKPYLLTQTLNQVIQKKFSDYINEYRIKEVKRLFNDPNFDHYTLLAIANEAGFNSKATFNRIIKKHTGKSPTQLRSEVS